MFISMDEHYFCFCNANENYVLWASSFSFVQKWLGNTRHTAHYLQDAQAKGYNLN
jgi:hypothetical protein